MTRSWAYMHPPQHPPYLWHLPPHMHPAFSPASPPGYALPYYSPPPVSLYVLYAAYASCMHWCLIWPTTSSRCNGFAFHEQVLRMHDQSLQLSGMPLPTDKSASQAAAAEVDASSACRTSPSILSCSCRPTICAHCSSLPHRVWRASALQTRRSWQTSALQAAAQLRHARARPGPSTPASWPAQLSRSASHDDLVAGIQHCAWH